MINGRRFAWRGPQPREHEERIVNAPDGLFVLAPASEAPAQQVRSDWAAMLPSEDEPPFIWEATR